MEITVDVPHQMVEHTLDRLRTAAIEMGAELRAKGPGRVYEFRLPVPPARDRICPTCGAKHWEYGAECAPCRNAAYTEQVLHL